ncbi:hypothetical protein BDN72DRAFT_849131 [Pluteus cervinus]|uniref:Uncharacterized protein n=1 Tax=Pluteus cervinus TaxID=181527 RepID=A0ACD3A909_9AGAR|nr:hypothetical protein BDN72DRAFT_849131 [Pluteus cervinus]
MPSRALKATVPSLRITSPTHLRWKALIWSSRRAKPERGRRRFPLGLEDPSNCLSQTFASCAYIIRGLTIHYYEAFRRH